jgi:hypothetical protein
VAVRWALGAHVVVTWRLGEVAPAWQCGWVLGAGEVAVFLRIATNLLKRHGVVGRIATNLTNRRDGLGFNIHPCTSVTKKYEYVVESRQTKQIVAVFVTKKRNTSYNRDKFNKSSQCFGLQCTSVTKKGIRRRIATN